MPRRFNEKLHGGITRCLGRRVFSGQNNLCRGSDTPAAIRSEKPSRAPKVLRKMDRTVASKKGFIHDSIRLLPISQAAQILDFKQSTVE